MSIPKLFALAGIKLQPAGDDQWKGLCPFHNDSSPSFWVYDDGSYHCFGCLAHGTIFSLSDGLTSEHRYLPDLTDVKDESEGLIGKLQKQLENELRKKLKGQDPKLQRQLYDVFDLTFLHAHARLRDGDRSLLEVTLFIQKKYDQILKQVVNLSVRKIVLS